MNSKPDQASEGRIPAITAEHNAVLPLAKHYADERDDLGLTSRAVLARECLRLESSRLLLVRQLGEMQQIVEKWRTVDGVCYCSIHCDCDASGYVACADQLEAALLSGPVKDEKA